MIRKTFESLTITRSFSDRQPTVPNEVVTRIAPRRGLQLLDFAELYAYRDLFRFLVWRQIKVRYAQSAVGVGWALLQPLFMMGVCTIVFGMMANMDSDGTPYALFSVAGLLPWTYFSNSITDGVASLVTEAEMLRKIYFPRVLLPLSAVIAKLIDLTIAAVLLVIVMIYFQRLPSPTIVLLPLFVLMLVLASTAVSFWLSAMAVQFRDVKHAMPFIVQLGMYLSPVVFPVSKVPEQFQLFFALNPMVGVIAGFRSSLLGTPDMPWGIVAVSFLSSCLLFVSGLLYFRQKERLFADVA